MPRSMRIRVRCVADLNADVAPAVSGSVDEDMDESGVEPPDACRKGPCVRDR